MTFARTAVVARLASLFTAVLLVCHDVRAQQPSADAQKVASRQLLLQELDAAVRRVPSFLALDAVPRAEDGTGQRLVLPEVRASSSRLLDTSLTVDYAFNRIWNVKQQQAITLHLRSYDGELVGPTLRVRPGDTLRVQMINYLPPDKPHHDDINKPHGFNTTNLHTHGLHVSPSGNSDNILVMIEPKQQFQNEIYIPEDHPPGTFWYHAHVHGSTAIQVSSGMAGTLIVEGGLDDVPEIKAAREQIFLLQQIPYLKDSEEDYYEIEGYEQFGPSAWSGQGNEPGGVQTHGWRTTVNGQTYPSVHFYPGEMQRWRFIHTGQREEVDLCLLKYDTAKQLLSDNAEPSAYLASAIPLHEVAADGLAYGFRWQRRHVELYPGYRSDLLVRIDEPGDYVLIDLEAPAERGLHQLEETAKLVAVVRVDGSLGQGPVMPLPDDRDLLHLRPHRSVTDEEVTENGELRIQRSKFQITLDGDPVFRAGDPGPDGDQEVFPFGKNGVRQLQLGKADEWHLTAEVANHPFHIHVNPFEILGHPWMTGDEQPRDSDGNVRTIWKDTIIIPDRAGTVRIRSRYERYIGKFVLHCHILDHEDRGMMQLVEIVGPGSGHHAGH